MKVSLKFKENSGSHKISQLKKVEHDKAKKVKIKDGAVIVQTANYEDHTPLSEFKSVEITD